MSRPLSPNISVFVGIPSLSDNDRFAPLAKNAIMHIKAQDCPVKILEPYVTPPYSGDFSKSHTERLLAITDRLNDVIEKFLKSNATHLWLVDADIEPPTHALDKLIRLDVDVASGIYAFHNDRHIYMFGRMKDGDQVEFIPRGAPGFRGSGVIGDQFKVGGGNGCLLAKRRVFESFHPDYAPLRFACPRTGVKTWASDLFFWYQVQKFGFTARVHGGVLCGHAPYHPLKSYIEEYGVDNLVGFERVTRELENMSAPPQSTPS